MTIIVHDELQKFNDDSMRRNSNFHKKNQLEKLLFSNPVYENGRPDIYAIFDDFLICYAQVSKNKINYATYRERNLTPIDAKENFLIREIIQKKYKTMYGHQFPGIVTGAALHNLLLFSYAGLLRKYPSLKELSPISVDETKKSIVIQEMQDNAWVLLVNFLLKTPVLSQKRLKQSSGFK